MKSIPTLRDAEAAAVPSVTLRERWNRAAARVQTTIADGLLSLAARLSIAAIFWQSGRTKVDGWLTPSDGAIALFRDEYRLPLVAPELAAQLAVVAEHLFPVLLVLGLATRLSALALLAMTLVIQVFVYPDAWPTHLSWAGLLMVLIGRGAGPLSLDRGLRLR